MNQSSMYVSGFVSGDGKDYSLPQIPAHRVEKLRARLEEKGATLIIRGQAREMVPAAAPIVKPSLSRTEGLGPSLRAEPLTRRGSAKEKPIKPVKPIVARTLTGKIKKARKATVVRPVVCVTTGIYYPSIKAAAAACEGTINGISRQIQEIKKEVTRRTTHRGMVHRYATPNEIAAQKMLTPKS